MKVTNRFFSLAPWAIAVAASCSAPASAQTSDAGDDTATRPATTTFLGDTGLWFVPTGEILPGGKVSVST